AAFLSDERSVFGAPPIARQKPRHDAVAISAVPDQHAARCEHTRELGDDAPVVIGIGEEPERREEIEDGVEATRPACRELPHVAAGLTKPSAGAAPARACEQFACV